MICDAMNSNGVFKEMLPAIHNLLHLYPITSATAEWTFSALKRLLTYLRSSMTDRLLLLHVHKVYTDSLDLVSIVKEFVARFEV